jgi:hypothetical protein
MRHSWLGLVLLALLSGCHHKALTGGSSEPSPDGGGTPVGAHFIYKGGTETGLVESGGFLYWISYDPVQGDSAVTTVTNIHRAPSDGSGPEERIAKDVGGAFYIQAGDTNVYWSSTRGTFAQTVPSGTPVMLTTNNSPLQVAGDRVYFFSSPSTCSPMSSVDYTESVPHPMAETPPQNSLHCYGNQAITDGLHVYESAYPPKAYSVWAMSDGHEEMDLEHEGSHCAPVAVDATNLYCATGSGGELLQYPKRAGGTAVTLAQLLSDLRAIVVDEASVYWIDNGSGSGKSIQKVAIGGGPLTTIVGGDKSPSGLAVDAASLYWTESDPSGARDGVMKLTPK